MKDEGTHQEESKFDISGAVEEEQKTIAIISKEEEIQSERGIDRVQKVNGQQISVFLLLNVMIGSGILNQPEVFKKSGIFGALIGFVFASTFTWVGLNVLIDSGMASQRLSFSELMKEHFGSVGEAVYDFFVIIYSLGALLSYITIIGGSLSEMFIYWGCQSEACGVYSVTSIVMTVFVLPLCLFRHLAHLAVVSVISIVCIVCVLTLTVIGGPILSFSPKSPYKIESSYQYNMFNINGLLVKLGSIIFALGCAPATFLTYIGMRRASAVKWMTVTNWSVSIGAFMLISMGLVGYISFGINIEGEILESFPVDIANPFKILLVIHLILYIPTDFVVLRYSCVKLTGNKIGELRLTNHVITSVLLLAGAVVLVLMLRYAGLSQGDAFGLILDFTGGLAASFTSFVAPAALALKVFGVKKPHIMYSLANILMLLFGLFVMVTVPTFNVLTFYDR